MSLGISTFSLFVLSINRDHSFYFIYVYICKIRVYILYYRGDLLLVWSLG